EPAIALRFHHAIGGLGQIEATVEMHAKHAPPVRRGQLLERDTVENACVAYHRIESAELIESRLDDRLAALWALHRLVGCHRPPPVRLAPLDARLRHGCAPAVAVHGPAKVVDHHRGTTTGEFDRIQAPQSAACAGDDDDLVGEVNHGYSLRF